MSRPSPSHPGARPAESRPVEVLHVTHQYAPETRGGVESHVRELVAAQRAAGIDAQVLTGSFAPWPAVGLERLEVDGVPVTRVHRDDLYFDLHSKAWHPGVEELVARELAKHLPRVVHVHHWIRLTSNLVEIALRTPAAVVVTLHDHWSSCPRAFRVRADEDACLRPLGVASCIDCVPRFGHEPREELALGIELFHEQMRAELLMAHAVLVGVDSTADRLATAIGLPRGVFRTLPLGHAPRFAGLPRLSPPREDERVRFAFWGGVARHKGVTVLLDAFGKLCAAHPGRAELHVLGAIETTELEAELRRLAADLPVQFHGSFDAAQLHAVAPHAGVFPSTCLETWGLVLDECFELGLPCVVSDLGALPERVAEGGLIARAGDAADLAARLAELLDPAVRRRLHDRRPGPAPDFAHYKAQLDWIYEQAQALAVDQREGRAPRGNPVPATRRAQLLLRQRESALARIIGKDGPR